MKYICNIYNFLAIPHENEIYMRHIQLFGMKIYFEGLGIICVKYILANISKKIYAKYIIILTYVLHIYFSMWVIKKYKVS